MKLLMYISYFAQANERISAQEPTQSQPSIATFNVIRRKGTIGSSTVYWEVDEANFNLSSLLCFSL